MTRTSPFNLGAIPNIPAIDAPTGLASIRPAAQDGLIYSLPVNLLDCIERYAPDFFSADELDQELAIADFCRRFYSMAFYEPTHKLPFHRFIQLLSPPEPIRTSCNAVAMNQSIRLDEAETRHSQTILDDVQNRRLAYLGWLLHNSAFLDEKQALQHQYSELVVAISQFPTYPAQHFVKGLHFAHGLRCDGNILTSFADDFDAFFLKWQIGGLATWDIPRPSNANIGGQASLCRFVPDQMAPTVRLPRTLRLSARARLETLIRSAVPEHLGDWESVQENSHPLRLSYGRWSRLFQLAFYRDIVLSRNYSDRMNRQVGRLDQAFSEFFGDVDVQAIRKLRSTQSYLLRQSGIQLV